MHVHLHHKHNRTEQSNQSSNNVIVLDLDEEKISTRFQDFVCVTFLSKHHELADKKIARRDQNEEREKNNQKTWMDKLIKFILDALQASTIFDNEAHAIKV